MKLKFISCSGANEHTCIEDLVCTFANIYLPEVVFDVDKFVKDADIVIDAEGKSIEETVSIIVNEIVKLK